MVSSPDIAGSGTAIASSVRIPSKVVPFPTPGSDRALLEALRAGNRDAAGALFDRYADHVKRVVARVMGPDRELPDLVQEVFVAVLGSIDRVEDARSLKAWITSIAVFTARGRIRKRRRWQFLRFVEPAAVPEQHAWGVSPELTEAVRATYAVLECLDADERIAFALRFIDGMELTEVAAACGVSLATIKRRLKRAREAFMHRARQQPALAEWLEVER